MSEVLLKIRDLQIDYKTDLETVHAVNGVSLTLNKGETLGLVGETGAGKTTTALSIMGLLPERTARTNRGSIWFDEQDILAVRDKDGAAVSEADYIASHVPEISEGETLEAPAVEAPAPAYLSNRQLQAIRGEKISMIFQDPMTALNPVLTVGDQILEALLMHNEGHTRAELETRVDEVLEMVGIMASRKKDYPHQFSGGMKQRVVIAMALACDPMLLIADEPTTALDVTIQAQILSLMNDIRERLGTSMLMITHDLGIIAETCDDVAVMYAGQIVEYGTVEDIFSPGRHHPYTTGLFEAIPNLTAKARRLKPIDGMMPDPADLPAGCKFAERCSHCTDRCRAEEPGIFTENGHRIKCFLFQGKVQQSVLAPDGK